MPRAAQRRRGAAGGAEGVSQGQPGVQNSGAALRRRRAARQPGGLFQHHGRDPLPAHQEGRPALIPAPHLVLLRQYFRTLTDPVLSLQSCPESGGASPRSLQDDDDDDAAGRKEKELQTEALLCAFDTLGKCWPRNTQTQGGFLPQSRHTF